MNKITLKRVGELIRAVLELLWNKPDGLRANELIAFIPQIIHLTDHEKEYVPLSNMPRYERYVRLATIPLAKAGWLVKSKKGRWRLTEEGKEACLSYPSVVDFYEAAVMKLEDLRGLKPGLLAEAEKAEEKAWEQIQDFLVSLNHWELAQIVSDLFVSMDYHVVWAAPPYKEQGHIDLVVNRDPIGVSTPKILVKIQHNHKPLTTEDARSFSSSLKPSTYGVLVSISGIESDLQRNINEYLGSNIFLVDAEGLFDLWIKYYSNHSSEASARFPLKIVYFLAGSTR